MIRRLALIAIAAAAATVLGAAPAYADDEIGLSRDGVTWTTELSDPLFDPAFRIVPGDVEVREFRVRNDGPSAGVLTVDVVASDPDAFLVSDDLTIEVRVANGAWRNVEPGTTRAATELEIAQGQDTRVQVRATFAWESTLQNVAVPFRVELTLSEDGDVAGEGEGDGDGGDGDDGGDAGGVDDSDGLPDTGSPLGAGILWVAAGFIGAGLALVRRGRDREEVVGRD